MVRNMDQSDHVVVIITMLKRRQKSSYLENRGTRSYEKRTVTIESVGAYKAVKQVVVKQRCCDARKTRLANDKTVWSPLARQGLPGHKRMPQVVMQRENTF